MYFKETHGTQFKYVAITEFRDITPENDSFKRTFKLTLANGSQVDWQFEDGEARKLLEGLENGGVVVNPN